MANPSKLDIAQTAKFTAEAQAAEAMTRRIDLEAGNLEFEREMRGAAEFEHRIYTFDDQVNEGSVQECMRVLGLWIRRPEQRPITISFNSPGGDLFQGLALYDFIQQIRNSGTRVDTAAIGMAASMGGVLLQAGERRTMTPNSYMLIHEVSAGRSGTVAELQDAIKFTNKLQGRCLDILAERSWLSVEEIAENWSRRDWWMDAAEAHDLGFCDEVA